MGTTASVKSVLLASEIIIVVRYTMREAYIERNIFAVVAFIFIMSVFIGSIALHSKRRHSDDNIRLSRINYQAARLKRKEEIAKTERELITRRQTQQENQQRRQH